MRKIFFCLLFYSSVSLSSDCLITWDLNDPLEDVTAYELKAGGQNLQLIGTDTDAYCSEFNPPIDPSTGQYQIVAYAVNQFGRSLPTEPVVFGAAPSPIGLTVSGDNGDCIATWSINNPVDEVTDYILEINEQQLTVAAGDNVGRCSEFDPPIDPVRGLHSAKIYAVNKWGTSEASDEVPFGVPGVVAGFGVYTP